MRFKFQTAGLWNQNMDNPKIQSFYFIDLCRFLITYSFVRTGLKSSIKVSLNTWLL